MKHIRRPDDTVAIRAQYFLYFGILGISLPYFNLYCHRIGFSGVQIGAIASVRSVAMVIFPLVWAILADRHHARRSIYIGCAAASACLWTGYLVTRQYVPMLIITLCHGIFFAPLISFLEAVTMDHLGRDKHRYGRVRLWGSVSFITIVLVCGWLIDHMHVGIILVAILGGFVLLALSSFGIPAPSTAPAAGRLSRVREFPPRETTVFLACSFLMLVSHGAYYGFFSIHLERLGFGGTFIGIAWALASIAEIVVMLRSKSIFDRFSLEKVLVFSLFVAALRWGVLSTLRSGPALLFAQLSHAVTYGTFHMASILYMDRIAPPSAKTLGQAANNAITYGLGLMVGFFLSGLAYDRIGGNRLFMASALVAAAAGLMFSLHLSWRPGDGKERPAR